jgi:hypothetical protein
MTGEPAREAATRVPLVAVVGAAKLRRRAGADRRAAVGGIGYFETPDLAAALRGMAERDVNARWQAEMAPFFADLDGRRPDEGFVRLTEIFHLADQLASAATEQGTEDDD